MNAAVDALSTPTDSWAEMGACNYSHLQQLFGCYMHQDWGYEGKDWPDLIDNFTRGETAVNVTAVAAELDSLLAEFSDDVKLHDQVYRVFGCYYDPRPDLGGPNLREWLSHVAEYVRKIR